MDLGDSASTPLPKSEGPAVGEPEQEVERHLPEGLAGDGQEFPMDGVDGSTSVEGDGEKGDLSPVRFNKNDSLAKASLSAALVLMLAVTSWMLYKKVLAPPLKPPLPPVTEIDKQIELYSKKMVEMEEGLDEAWAMASDAVKRAFTMFFMPSAEREHVAEYHALSYYKMHVLDMSQEPRPAAHDDAQLKKEYLYKLQMLTSILEAATRRIDALRTLQVNEELPALILGRESGKREVQIFAGGIDLNAFYHNLAERGIHYIPLADAPQTKQTVPADKALELLDLLTMEEKMTNLDRRVHEAFEHFLKGQGLNLRTLQAKDTAKVAVIKLPRDPNAMDTRTLAQFLHSRYRSAEAEFYRREILDALSVSWNEKTLQRATELFRKHHKDELEHLLRQKKGNAVSG